MTRKDYELIAKIIGGLPLETIYTGSGRERHAAALRRSIASCFASELEGDNPAFDEDRFLAAVERGE